MAKAYIGTSGWQYRNWRGSFYPENLPQKDWLRYYSQYFDTVEVNSSFYRQTRASTFKKWQEEASPPAGGFVFSVKGHRYITHVKLLKDSAEPVRRFFENVSAVKGDKHVILWQLPPRFKKDVERLEEFLQILSHLGGVPQAQHHPRGEFKHAFEFRHETWINPETWQALENAPVECATVLQDWKEWPILGKPHGSFVYMRFHGKKRLYHSGYSDEELEKIAKRIKGWTKRGLAVYTYFNNDAEGHAAPNAKALKELIEK